jgi:hypothetical protein
LFGNAFNTQCGIGLTQVSINGNVFSGAQITIINDTEASINYPAGTAVNGTSVTITVNGNSFTLNGILDIVAPPPAVNLVSAVLDNTATTIIATFDVDTDSYGGGNCSLLLDSSTLAFLGTNPTCVFSDPKNMYIIMGTPNTVQPKVSKIKMLASNTLYALIDGDFGIHPAVGNATVGNLTNPTVAVNVQLVAASSYNECDGLFTVDGTSVTGSAGRSFTKFQWSSSSSSSAVQSYITSANSNSLSTLYVNTTDMSADSSTTFTLTIANWIGETVSLIDFLRFLLFQGHKYYNCYQEFKPITNHHPTRTSNNICSC